MIYLVEDLESKEQSSLARALLQYGLGKEYGRIGTPRIAYQEQGKPYLEDAPEINFNYSHSAQGILCGISDHEVGVDIERVIIYKERLAMRICHSDELKLLEKAALEGDEYRNRLLSRIWTLKESYLKYLGIGIRRDLRELNFKDCEKDYFEQEGCSFRIFEGEKYVAAVCGFEREVPIEKVRVSALTVSSKNLRRGCTF